MTPTVPLPPYHANETDYKPNCAHPGPLVPWVMDFRTHQERRLLCPWCGATVPDVDDTTPAAGGAGA